MKAATTEAEAEDLPGLILGRRLVAIRAEILEQIRRARFSRTGGILRWRLIQDYPEVRRGDLNLILGDLEDVGEIAHLDLPTSRGSMGPPFTRVYFPGRGRPGP